jgi:hypothetical protein
MIFKLYIGSKIKSPELAPYLEEIKQRVSEAWSEPKRSSVDGDLSPR